jgi:alpha-tubulin suppressor-like RCC1 family protein
MLQANTPVAVSGLAGVRALAGGSDFFCAVTTGGNVNCWGNNLSGQLGTGNPKLGFSASVTPASDLNNVTSIAAGARHACALGNGKVKCWGDNNSGQLGNGTQISSSVPVPVI